MTLRGALLCSSAGGQSNRDPKGICLMHIAQLREFAPDSRFETEREWGADFDPDYGVKISTQPIASDKENEMKYRIEPQTGNSPDLRTMEIGDAPDFSIVITRLSFQTYVIVWSTCEPGEDTVQWGYSFGEMEQKVLVLLHEWYGELNWTSEMNRATCDALWLCFSQGTENCLYFDHVPETEHPNTLGL